MNMKNTRITSHAVMWAAAILVVALVAEKESAIPILVVLATLSLGILNKSDKPDSQH